MSYYNTRYILAGSNYAAKPTAGTAVLCNSRLVTGCTTNGTTTLTTTQSFLKAGIAVDKQIRVADVPSGTTIVSIAANGLSLVMSAAATASHTGLTVYFDHPDYPGAPPRPDSELDDYPMENLLTWDRRAPWKVTKPGSLFSTAYVDIDLGTSRSLRVFGMLGLLKPASFPFSIALYYRTSAQGYDPSTAGGVWSTINNSAIWLYQRDLIVENESATGLRYLRLAFQSANSGDGWTVGKLLAATAFTDLGFLYGPDSELPYVTHVQTVEGCDGGIFRTKMGEPTRRFVLKFPYLENTSRAAVQSLGNELYPFLFHDGALNSFLEAVPAGPATMRHRFGCTGDPGMTSDIFAGELELRGLY